MQWSYLEALRALWHRSAYERGSVVDPFAQDRAPDAGLIRTRHLLQAWPQRSSDIRFVHIAGSKGKGSTAAFAASVLSHGGLRTGFYSSPHLHSLRERIVIDGRGITEPEFAALTQQAHGLACEIERTQPELGQFTAFELTTAMALRYFAEQSCAVAIIEVGLGGTYDATNVIDGDVSVITPLDYEHTAVLGPTLTAIAENKAGIIKRRRPVVSARQQPEALRVIEQVAGQLDAQLLLAGRDWTSSGDWRSFRLTGPWGVLSDLRSGLIGNHQIDNAGNAIAALLMLGDRQFPVLPDAIRDGLAATQWPGRYEIVRHDSTRVILDGAHSPASARVLAETLRAEERDRPIVIVLGPLNDKDVAAIVRELAPVATQFVATMSAHPRALPLDDVVSALRNYDAPVASEPTVAAALDRAIVTAGRHGAVVVTGSLTTAAEARVRLGLGHPDPDPSE
jgi:dihydrofolate synthase/folylpolyglutamate synthase